MKRAITLSLAHNVGVKTVRNLNATGDPHDSSRFINCIIRVRYGNDSTPQQNHLRLEGLVLYLYCMAGDSYIRYGRLILGNTVPMA